MKATKRQRNVANSDGNPAASAAVGTSVILDFYSSAFCDPCIATRAVLSDVGRLVPAVTIHELDVARDAATAETAGIRVTPTIVVHAGDGSEVFRAEGVPTVNQVLVAIAKAM